MKLTTTPSIIFLFTIALNSVNAAESGSKKNGDIKLPKPNNFMELMAKNDNRSDTSYIAPFELKKVGKNYFYFFHPYAGDGLHIRSGKIDILGNLIERKVKYNYCSHSTPPKDLCYEAELIEKFDQNGKISYVSGKYMSFHANSKKVTKSFLIKDKESLLKARSSYKEIFKPIVPLKLDPKILVPITKPD